MAFNILGMSSWTFFLSPQHLEILEYRLIYNRTQAWLKSLTSSSGWFGPIFAYEAIVLCLSNVGLFFMYHVVSSRHLDQITPFQHVKHVHMTKLIQHVKHV
ncbi:unnamed protein product [Ilex paraguariensis]|uniref:Uncharacterized protein n=1 Tax=Ilex paraguariensis TaxID=185542 RepID=A0ABC8RLR4_9AQUA